MASHPDYNLPLRHWGQLQKMQLALFFSQLQQKQLEIIQPVDGKKLLKRTLTGGHSPPLSLAPG
ncbi:hypothetical protein EUU23_10855 [Sphingorhabdus sp. IMCC26285]|jgi:hypothetical protein|uniref:Uncharacterized protein n=1 Tax=Sphingorhabdus profundilacus TaxID=2509718 RepID=A0A6I4LXM2_9SPHN|nr:hypothetical protein [Sphingorhabdus profundilacus]MVZ98192.1 hypothetical protein [Sphingorhabdus profundilacus]